MNKYNYSNALFNCNQEPTHNLSFCKNILHWKKEKKIFLIYKEIQQGSGAKSYMTNGLFTYG